VVSKIRRSCSPLTASSTWPGPGERGGEITFFWISRKIKAGKHDNRAILLRTQESAEVPNGGAADLLTLEGAAEHNLRTSMCALPLNDWVCVTGVSGSGKSTLVQDVLYRALLKHKGRPTQAPGAHRALKGAHR